ncbi:HEAT repeat domain-containing protein [Hymenobacter tibetensis]|uniref:HEAT repeat domain-containing protein n=1 Tax=Hymenobacter tibetensis TaxID=497967 RepID=A0ABY4CV86_9BACT|nr:HEAT repeat domain-containing protein [Hymenobacter tibetensis]UOG73677.1 HEAT repeat domain-containing protein [Hymenobacter tibetensis]
MNCEQAQYKLIDHLNQQLPAAEKEVLQAHLAACPECQQELETMQQMWHTLGCVEVPEPSENVRPAFYSMLASYKEEMAATPTYSLAGLRRWLQAVVVPRPVLQLAYSVCLLGVGLAAGWWLNTRNAPSTDQQQLATLSKQVEKMQQVMLLTLIENPSATERLRAVSYTKELSSANPRVVEALLSTLNHDENVNVRLATLEALAELAYDPAVRLGLVQALPQQESALVQSALADVMVQLQEKRSVQPLRRLLDRPDLNEAVKSKIRESLKSLSDGQAPKASTSTQQPYHETLHHPQSDRAARTIV